MVMSTIQVRMSNGILEKIDKLVEENIYESRSEAIRDAVRRFVWNNEVGTVAYKGNAVDQVRKARTQLATKDVDIDEINKL